MEGRQTLGVYSSLARYIHTKTHTCMRMHIHQEGWLVLVEVVLP